MLKKAERNQIADMVKAAEFALGPLGVRSIFYSIGEDHTGDPSITFFVTATSDAVISEFGGHIRSSLDAIVEPTEYGLLAYCDLAVGKKGKGAA